MAPSSSSSPTHTEAMGGREDVQVLFQPRLQLATARGAEALEKGLHLLVRSRFARRDCFRERFSQL